MYEFFVMRRIVIFKVDVVVLVYFLDKLEFFMKLERYMDEIESCCVERNWKIFVIIVFNKLDIFNLLELMFVNVNGLKISVCVYLEGKFKC